MRISKINAMGKKEDGYEETTTKKTKKLFQSTKIIKITLTLNSHSGVSLDNISIYRLLF